MQSTKEDILKLVAQYITEKHKNKTWTAGKDWVQYAGPYFDDKEYVKAVSTLLDEWLVLGNDAIEFEKRFPAIVGKTHGVVVNSGSSANLLMMAAIISQKSWAHKFRVIVPVAGFPTTVNPIIQLGLNPVFVDIDLDTLNLNLDQVEAAASKSNVLTFAHVLGNPPNMDRVMEIVNKYHLTLLEDCCDALGSTYNDKPLGSFGRLTSCSFYPAHHITMGEGGFVACNNKEDEAVIRSLREWGRGCFRKGTPINSGECIKTIESLKVGELVTTHNGNNKKITRVFQKEYDGNYYTFNCRLKGNISSTDYHPHLILTPHNNEPEWIESKDIKIGDYFLEKIPIENSSDQFFTWSYKTLYKEKHEKLKAEPDLMRLIGYWLAEGCANKGLKGKNCSWYAYTVSFNFNKNESEYVADVNRLMLKYFGVKGFSGRKYFVGNCTATCFKSRKAYEFFICFFNKLSHKKSLPCGMVNWKSTLTNELVNGYWRGDGNYSETNNSFRLDGVSFELIEQMRRILLKHGIITSYFNTPKEKRQKNQILNGRIINAKYDIHTIAAYGKNAELFSNLITHTSIVSKSDKFNAFIANGYVLYPVSSIDIVKINETVYNLEVDSNYHQLS